MLATALLLASLAALAALLGGGAVGVEAQAAPQRFVATDDAYTSSASTGANFGQAAEVYACTGCGGSTAPRDFESFLKFDLTGVDPASVTKATLKLVSTGTSDLGANVHPVTPDGWNENGVTWANAPAEGTTALGSTGATTLGTTYSVDVTNNVKSRLSGGASVAFALKSADVGRAEFASAENATYAGPTLEVETGADQPAASAVMVGAGDIASKDSGCTTTNAGDCDSGRDVQTGNLVEREVAANPDAKVFVLGDNAYGNGTLTQYRNFYKPAWGDPAVKSRTYPIPGNHEYYDTGTNPSHAKGYWDYFTSTQGASITTDGPRVPAPAPGGYDEYYYAYDVGTKWRAIALNSQERDTSTTDTANVDYAPGCGADANGQAQLDFLVSELQGARSAGKNTVVYWHHSRFSNSPDHPTSEGAAECAKPFFDRVVANGGDLVLSGHSHGYERFSKRDATGARSASGGVTQIVAGTGGRAFDGFLATPQTPSDARSGKYGVLKLQLYGDRYEWALLATDGTTPDSGSETVNP